MGGAGLSGGAHVRFIFLRRHVLDHIVSVRGPVEDSLGLGCRRLRPVYQRLQRIVRVRRPCHLRHIAGQVGSPDHRLHLCRHDGRRGLAGPARHHCRLCSGQILASGLCRMYVLRAWKRNCRYGGDALHRQMVPGRADGAGDGPSVGHRALGYRCCTRTVTEVGGRECRPRLQSLRDGQAGRLRRRPYGCRANPLGAVRRSRCQVRQGFR